MMRASVSPERRNWPSDVRNTQVRKGIYRVVKWEVAVGVMGKRELRVK
jgi:hypothetical protein